MDKDSLRRPDKSFDEKNPMARREVLLHLDGPYAAEWRDVCFPKAGDLFCQDCNITGTVKPFFACPCGSGGKGYGWQSQTEKEELEDEARQRFGTIYCWISWSWSFCGTNWSLVDELIDKPQK